MTEPINGNGNGLTTKELLLRLESKFDGYMAEHAHSHAELVEGVNQLRLAHEHHIADDHADRVDTLQAESQRESGRRDILKWIFGTSLGALVVALLALSKAFGV